MASASSHTLPSSLYVPAGETEHIATTTGLSMDVVRGNILKSAQSIFEIYSDNGSKSFWNETELSALHVLLANRCLRKRDAAAAAADVSIFEKILVAVFSDVQTLSLDTLGALPVGLTASNIYRLETLTAPLRLSRN